MASNHLISVGPDEAAQWTMDWGPAGSGETLAGLRTELTVDEAEVLAARIAEAQVSEDPDARTVGFPIVWEVLLEAGLHPALCDRIEPLIAAAFRSRKDQPILAAA
jgi:hypothetical protein